VTFDDANLLKQLETLTPARLDELAFGVIRMNGEGIVMHYNAAEAAFAGLKPERVAGLNFFSDVAPCTNNYMVAGRYEEAELDETIDYVFTLRMKPTPVKLRLLKSSATGHMYLAVLRK
jgi:photoactive yellow protein